MVGWDRQYGHASPCLVHNIGSNNSKSPHENICCFSMASVAGRTESNVIALFEPPTGPKLARAQSRRAHRIPTLPDFLSRRLARVATGRPLIHRGILTGGPLRMRCSTPELLRPFSNIIR